MRRLVLVSLLGPALAGVALHSQAADLASGSRLYAQHCASCHGASGHPVMPGAPNLTRPQALMRPDAALLLAIRNGRMGMPGFRGLLTDTEILDIVAYMRTLLR